MTAHSAAISAEATRFDNLHLQPMSDDAKRACGFIYSKVIRNWAPFTRPQIDEVLADLLESGMPEEKIALALGALNLKVD